MSKEILSKNELEELIQKCAMDDEKSMIYLLEFVVKTLKECEDLKPCERKQISKSTLDLINVLKHYCGII